MESSAAILMNVVTTVIHATPTRHAQILMVRTNVFVISGTPEMDSLVPILMNVQLETTTVMLTRLAQILRDLSLVVA